LRVQVLVIVALHSTENISAHSSCMEREERPYQEVMGLQSGHEPGRLIKQLLESISCVQTAQTVPYKADLLHTRVHKQKVPNFIGQL